jgi:hypothetical protein
MKSAIFSGIFLSLLCCAVGCSHDDTDDALGVDATQSPKIDFVAGQDNETSRSYFDENDSGRLLWSNYDNIGVYAVDEDGQLMGSDVCEIRSISVGTTRAEFLPRTLDTWGKWRGVKVATDSITFYAYCPHLDKTTYDDDDNNNSELVKTPPANYANGEIMLNVPQTQTGEFGRYQICYADGVTLPANVEADASMSVDFKKFHLATSLIRVNLTLDGASVHDTVTVKRLVVKSNVQLVGNCHINVTNGALTPIEATSAEVQEAMKTVAVEFSQPMVVTKSSNAYISFVVLPSAGPVELSFAAYSGDVSESTTVTKENATIAKGIQAGVRYNFKRSLVVTDVEANYLVYGTANCLMLDGDKSEGTLDVTPYRTVRKTYITVEEEAIDAEATLATSAEILWCEPELIIGRYNLSADCRSLEVAEVSGAGNAVIAIKDAAGTILWSYHIWKPATSVTDNMLKYGSYRLMPLALGATQVVTANSASKSEGIGLFYQWGRKDPLGRLSSLPTKSFHTTLPAVDWENDVVLRDIVENSSANGDELDRDIIGWTMQHPTTFISISESENNLDGNWASLNNTYLWMSSKKTIYDPCPEGYHVASSAIFNMLTQKSFNQGSNFNYGSGEDFYVSGGRRRRVNGEVYRGSDNSYYGWYWSTSSVTLSSNGNNFSVVLTMRNMGDVKYDDTWNRAEAMSVRCMKE